jgi:hypothetical protein
VCCNVRAELFLRWLPSTGSGSGGSEKSPRAELAEARQAQGAGGKLAQRAGNPGIKNPPDRLEREDENQLNERNIM